MTTRWLESLTNPLLKFTDLEAVVKVAKQREVCVFWKDTQIENWLCHYKKCGHISVCLVLGMWYSFVCCVLQGIKVIVDNIFMTPYFICPLELRVLALMPQWCVTLKYT